MKYLTKINPWKTALFITIFEFFTFSILPYFKFHHAINGFLIGFIGALLAIELFNLMSSKGFKLPIWVDGKDTTIKKLNLMTLSLANGIFISFLFIVQKEVGFGFRSEALNQALLGFSATFLAMIGCIAIYNTIIKFTKIRLNGLLEKEGFKIGKIDLVRSCFFVALFELFILPSMGLFFIVFQGIPFYLTYPLVGLCGGFIGSLIASLFYNIFAKFFKGIGFELE